MPPFRTESHRHTCGRVPPLARRVRLSTADDGGAAESSTAASTATGGVAAARERPPAWFGDAALTPEGNWTSWRRAGFDARSVFHDARFVDVARGDFCLDLATSPAPAEIGFVPLPELTCRC